VRLLLDTNRYTDVDRGDAEAMQAVLRADEVYLSFITLAELHAGFRNGSKRAENERRLKRFLSQADTFVIYPDELRVQLQREGKPIPDHDIWIAALALQHNLTLYARDKHFDHLPQLARL
jgi:tRNA(fMet)-specific endonuclease VapC